ncbi:type II toxin-antitoxin system RelE/ParE family toxin [Rhizobium sp. G21]|uniref:type II toxin-antitoxin system RelE/ParE family toxin n=1 Tax=Rhizobium sp. G21 TaxID=2758439 RepID=UPI00160367A7|nr:type II toxin-antitoxin system RelE/ParE family toxin [Rhizobium sp. G21]MBB1250232.1 type II toxin-antitoxin system RelE/ParE family toxin [Rhizobium sp. G21]
MSLNKTDRQVVAVDIAKVEFGWPMGMPTCRLLRDGVLEVQSSIRNGRVEARIYSGIDDGVMLLLHGAEGKGGQQATIKLAIKRWKDYQIRK